MYKKFIKRAFDIILALLAFPFFGVIYIIVGTLIKLEDGGKVFYKAERIGKDSKIFKMYKFRSMKENAPNILNEDGSTYNSRNDSRVTKIGKILRETSIDETAQIINVIKGDMSIIGPRASGAEVLNTYKEDELDKMKVRPGITGYTQAYYRNNLTVREKRLKDAWYANNISLWLDIKIFFKTISTVLKKEGIYTNSEDNIKNIEEKKKKALIIANRTIKIGNVYYSMINPLIELGYEVHVASNFRQFKGEKTNDLFLFKQIDFIRNPFDIRNVKAYKQLMNLLKTEKYDVIHCNNPISGILGRICGNKIGVKKIIYTAHGFHFYKGAPLINSILYKNVENYLAKYTDGLITINTEDFESAKKMKLRDNGKCYYIHGVGIDTKYEPILDEEKHKLLKELNLKEDDIICIAMGDLNKNKNYETMIKAISLTKNNKIHLMICGIGDRKNVLEKLVNKYNLQNQIHFLGFRNDISKLLQISNIFILASYREGLSRAIMEAMTVGLPCIVSKIRGNVDLIDDGKGGYLVDPNKSNEMSIKIINLASNEELRNDMGEYNKEKVKQNDIENVKKEMKKIYEEVIKNENK